MGGDDYFHTEIGGDDLSRDKLDTPEDKLKELKKRKTPLLRNIQLGIEDALDDDTPPSSEEKPPRHNLNYK